MERPAARLPRRQRHLELRRAAPPRHRASQPCVGWSPLKIGPFRSPAKAGISGCQAERPRPPETPAFAGDRACHRAGSAQPVFQLDKSNQLGYLLHRPCTSQGHEDRERARPACLPPSPFGLYGPGSDAAGAGARGRAVMVRPSSSTRTVAGSRNRMRAHAPCRHPVPLVRAGSPRRRSGRRWRGGSAARPDGTVRELLPSACRLP